MKTAGDLVREISRYVMPPHGVAIQVEEKSPDGQYDPNWLADAGTMDTSRSVRFSQMVAELRRADRLIDWSGVSGRPGHRKVRMPNSDST
jgi:hypothetical protein